MLDQQTSAVLKTWREGLVGLTRGNRLIKFTAPKASSVLIDSPGPDEVFARISSGKSQVLHGDAEPAPGEGDARAAVRPRPIAAAGAHLHCPRPEAELAAVLRNLMRRARTDYLDRGLSVLYVAFGLLKWIDTDGTLMASPLLLVPVTLEPNGPKGTPRLRGGEDDAVLNPALTLRLKEFNIVLPAAEELDGLTATEALVRVRAVLAGASDFKQWELQERIYLSPFSFAKEAMYRDLLDNEATIVDHPVVRALANSDPTKQSSEFQFEPIEPTDIDRVAPPEDVPLVLDADSSQRAAIASALAGRTFVMDGPPGTGKSQTIANLIGAMLHAGKTVLFVSEKMAALDVVRNRLAEAGLGSYLLELHSHKATRREVAAELRQTLDNITLPPNDSNRVSRSAARDRRRSLNEYAAAMNETRQPLNSSVHHVLGLLGNLSDVPSGPVPDSLPTELSEQAHERLQETIGRLVRAWRPAAQGESFLWRGVIDGTSLDVRLYQAETTLEQLAGTADLHEEVCDAFDLRRPSDAPRLADLLEHHRDRPPGCLDEWLCGSESDRNELNTLRDRLGQALDALRSAGQAVLDTAGVAWTSLPDAASLPDPPQLRASNPPPLRLQDLPASDLIALADRFESDAIMLDEHAAALNALALTLGLPPVETFTDADRLIRLVHLRGDCGSPLRRWFTTQGLAEARRAAATLHDESAQVAAAESRASLLFTPEALHVSLTELQDRFANLHNGLRKLSGGYRSDKRTVAGLLHNATDVKAGIKHLSDAVAWGQTVQHFEASAARSSDQLGTYWKGHNTDFEALARVFSAVEDALALVNGPMPPELVTYLCGDTDHDAYSAMTEAAHTDLERWRRNLAPAPSLAARPQMLAYPIAMSIGWLSAHVEPARAQAERVRRFDTVTGRTHTASEVLVMLELTGRARAADKELQANWALYGSAFGSNFVGGATDLVGLDHAIAWSKRMRELSGGPLDSRRLAALRDSEVTDALRPAYAAWIAARDRIINAFGPSRQEELLRDFDSFRDAVTLMRELRDDTVGQQEWFAYLAEREAVATFGLDPTTQFCIDQRIAAAAVPKVLQRAVLRAWSDSVIRHDERLRPLLASERDTLVDDYRAMDRALTLAATSTIIRAANTRRPTNTDIGEPSLIRWEGGKQKKHIPVRELISRARTTVQSIKPVFMMSPLAVSQYLPSDLTFDLVIFDEASQVTPGEAINCIYRGRALVLAGDDKQLPPTTFFERAVEDDSDDDDIQDFQSVLELAKACGAFNNLGLRWHYRSRHEDLIAFSNYRFYDGKLITYPSAIAEADDVGVSFIQSHGEYRRGGGADNPIEASAVAARVIEHFSNRPELTLGVVTFSVAQADAVYAAIDRARDSRRDLDRFFDTDDRLAGFFVRSLESVQGDERDVIIFSVGYGPDEAGRITTNFGVLNKAKGWRRLNVGVTRARQRVEVVASMRAGDIPPSTNESVEHLRAYLDYADRGRSTLAIPYSVTGREPESPFEDSVIDVIRSWGYSVEPQVGAAGFRIDIGVRHTAHPGAFALGVECDGYHYHSAPSARDRDRLRDQILTGLGWRLHRIWGTAWYRDRPTEAVRLRAVIEEAMSDPLPGRLAHGRPTNRQEVTTVAAPPTGTASWTTAYQLAKRVPLPRWVEPGASDSHRYMHPALTALAKAEGPIHLEIVYERLREWWDIGRISYRVRDNIERAIQRADVQRQGDFIDAPDRPVNRVRIPGSGVVRKVDHVHVDELGLAVEMLLADVGGAGRGEVLQHVARIFGWNRAGAIVDRRISEAIDRRVGLGTVHQSGNSLRLVR